MKGLAGDGHPLDASRAPESQCSLPSRRGMETHLVLHFGHLQLSNSLHGQPHYNTQMGGKETMSGSERDVLV